MAQIGDDVTDPDTGIVGTVVWTGGRVTPLLCDPYGWASVGIKERSARPAKSVTGRRLTASATPSQNSLT
jgi:hypothetical protein